MNRVWTEEEIEILRRDREAKVPVPVTAAKLGRPVPATYARARLIGTLVQPHQSWDEASATRLKDLVLADPPLTDKRIAEELGRTVTQIRWKMQDLGLIGVRDLSKLAKVTAAGAARPRVQETITRAPHPQEAKAAQPRQVIVERVRPRVKAPAPAAQAPVVAPSSMEDLRSGIETAVKNLEAAFASQLKKAVAASEAGMIQAAKDAIAAKQQIDQRLGESARAAADEKKQAETARLEALRKAEEERRKRQAKPAVAPKIVASKPTAPALRPVLPVRPVAANQPAPIAAPPALPPAPKILVTDAPSARATAPEPEASVASGTQISGRGGWKSVRRDPARVAAQAKAKAKPTNRADAVDLAQAAQNAIARFIAERGVTRTETVGIPALVSRLQARGYIVVRDETGWTIDQRHRIGSEDALIAFADARGITIDVAA